MCVAEHGLDEVPDAKRFLVFGSALSMLGDHARSRAALEESIALARSDSNAWVLGMSLWMLAAELLLRYPEPDPELKAAPLLKESEASLRPLGDPSATLGPIFYSGVVAQRQKDRPMARKHFQQCLEILKVIGDKYRTAAVLDSLAELACEEGSLAEAGNLYAQALRSANEAGGMGLVVGCLERLAQVASLRRDWRRAARLLAAARARSSSRNCINWCAWCTDGYTNRQIADQLVISERTTENHLSHILSKLGLESRTQLATWTLQHARP